MCLPAAGAAGAAAASATSALSAIGTVVSMVGTVAGIVQAQQSAQMQAAQYQQQMNVQYQNAQRQAHFERQQQVQRHMGEVRAQQAAALSYQNQVQYNNQAANAVYTQEQVKLQEARNAAAFKSQEIYAKQIGGMGKVLASGATGQSVGLLALDQERQAGFALAKENASLRSAEQAMGVGMDVAFQQNQSANNQAFSKVPSPIQAPQLAPDPAGVGENLNLGIPAYSWS